MRIEIKEDLKYVMYFVLEYNIFMVVNLIGNLLFDSDYL